MSEQFDQRVKARFPVGSSAEALSSEMTKEGFSVTSYRQDRITTELQYVARRDYSDFPCEDSWIVTWRVSGDSIAEVEGTFGMICP